jgi:hypothetical protein
MKRPFLTGALVLTMAMAQNVSCAPRQSLETIDPVHLSTEAAELSLVKKLGLRRLTAEDVRRAVVGRQFATESYPSGIKTGSTERFTPQMTYERRGDFGMAEGQYQIVRDTLCISFRAGRSECRRFYRDSTGTFYQEYLESGSMELGRVIFQ